MIRHKPANLGSPDCRFPQAAMPIGDGANENEANREGSGDDPAIWDDVIGCGAWREQRGKVFL